jgi:hypothetical protein
MCCGLQDMVQELAFPMVRVLNPMVNYGYLVCVYGPIQCVSFYLKIEVELNGACCVVMPMFVAYYACMV